MLLPCSSAGNTRGVGSRSCGHGAPLPRPRQRPALVPTRTYLGGTRGRLRGAAASGGGGRRPAEPGQPRPSRGRSHGGTAPGPLPRTGGRCCCGGLRAPLWLCSESYRGHTTHLKPASPQDPGEGEGRGGREETGVGARSRSFRGAEPSHSSISRAVAPGCRAGLSSASPALAGAGLRPRSAPLPLDSRFDVRYQLQSAETFSFPAALTPIFGLFVW